MSPDRAPAPPREYDDLATDDPEFAEFFTVVEAPEPDRDTALRLLTYFARGLVERYNVAVEPAAVARTVPDAPLELVLRTGHVLRVPPGYEALHIS